LRFNDGLWTFNRAGNELWRTFVSKVPHGFSMTGSNVSKQLVIPFTHKLLRVHFYHTDNAYAANVTSTAFSLKRAVGEIGDLEYFEDVIINEATLTDSRAMFTFGDCFKFDSCVWTFVMNTSNGHIVYPLVFIEALSPVYQELFDKQREGEFVVRSI